MKLDLRDYQTNAFDQARDLVRQGFKRILIVSPTGSGKTVLATALMEMVQTKGKRANFVVDRVSLIDQTSATLDRYGMTEHGVIQSSHPRFRPSLPIQVCSVQTLARRRWPDSSVDLFDEAHVLHETHKARMKAEQAITIGLTATPFTKGLGKWFDAVVNVTTTRALIDQGWLAPYRVFSCVEPDMTGVTVKSTGEWDEKESSKKALEVVGDVVVEYLKHGGGRKFICSAVDTTHVEELQRQFQAAGVNVATYTYKDKEEDRADVTAEFRKPDSQIRGLITVTAASRGFDIPDVSCVIMARPLRKSLAEHIQLLGRGLRIAEGKTDCVARGTLVLTDCGEVPIEHVTLDHKVWDGENFVSHAGSVCRGMREVIEYDGLIATPDHEVMTDDGWTRFENAARWQRRIARTGIDGRPVRLTDDSEPRGARPIRQAASAGSVRSLFRRALGAISQLAQAGGLRGGVPALQWASAGTGPEVAVPEMPVADGSVHKSELVFIRPLRRAWHRVQVFFRERRGALGGSESWCSRPLNAVGPQEERWALRAWQSALDNAGWKSEQHPRVWWQAALHRISQGLSWSAVCGRDAGQAAAHDDTRGCGRTLEAAFVQTQGEVWDILNAGPLQRFTANGRLVHNCLVLCHSGNMVRFWSDCEDFFDRGLAQLDDGKPKDKKKPEKKPEAEPVKCPQCRAVHKPMPFCPSCGHEYPKKQTVQHVPGTLKELIAGGHKRELTRDLFPQIAGYALGRREGEAARRMAQAIFKDITGEFARVSWENVKPVEPSREVVNRIRAAQIRFSHRRAKEAATA